MFAHAPQAECQDDPGQPASDAHQHRQALRDLIGMGTDFAHLLHGQATAQAAQPATSTSQAADAPSAPTAPAASTLINLATAFNSTARAVRRCILLARSLDKPAVPTCDPTQRRAAARRHIIRGVEDRISRTGEGDTAEALHAELHDRLDAPDLDDDIATRPATEIVIEICRDLGLAAQPGTRPWKRRTPADIRQLCARAAAPSGTHQPGPAPQGPGRNPTQPTPGFHPAHRAATHAQPAPVHAGNDPPDDPGSLIASILRHPGGARWRPPPSN